AARLILRNLPRFVPGMRSMTPFSANRPRIVEAADAAISNIDATASVVMMASSGDAAMNSRTRTVPGLAENADIGAGGDATACLTSVATGFRRVTAWAGGFT